MNRLGEYYLCIPRPLEIRAENQGPIFQKVFIYFLFTVRNKVQSGSKQDYLSAKKIQETYDVSVEILRQWAASGKVTIVKMPRGK